jgi:hypothetical protein
LLTVTAHLHTARPPRPGLRPKGTAIRTDNTDDTDPFEIEPAELVALLEAHLADLNTHLALNTMALAAFGVTPILPPDAPDPTTAS